MRSKGVHGGALVGLAALACVSCAAGGTPSGGGSGGTGAAAGAASGGNGGGGAGGAGGTGGDIGGGISAGGGGGASGDGCADEAKLVYVLGKTQELYSFNPGTLTLSQVGVVNCPQNGAAATPFSMSVARDGTAWVLYNDGHMYHVDTKTAACTATSFVPDQQGFKKFGMGFVSDAPGSSAETLFVADEFGIGKVDTATLSLAKVGDFGFSAAAELTGTGDARLFGFFYGFPPYIAEIDKATSMLGAEAPLDTVDAGTGFAFAFWGGKFWIFTAPNGTSSQIDRYDPATQATTTVKTDLGFKVIGAGVSTCAPLEEPK